MNKSTKISLLVGGIVVVLIGVIGITFAFFSTGGIQNIANTFQSGCLNISLTDESSSISLDKVLPVTDVEGLEGISYDFTVTNTCNTSANYEINLESLNEQTNSLNADYIKVSLSSDTVDNVISILSDNTSITPTISNAYEACTLYTGVLTANETKTYHLKLWLDYDATVEQAANKVYSSKINVVANPEIEVVDNQEAKFTIKNTTVTATLTNNITSATYCITTDNICNPTTSTTIENHNYTIELEESEEEQVVCTKLNGTSKIICSEPFTIEKTGSEIILSNYPTLLKRTDFSQPVTNTTTGTIYYEDTSKGKTYYFAGNPTDNWVKFAGFYWRIIRINENGSIRLMYSGDSGSGPINTGALTNANTSVWNGNNWDNTYVGYMFSEAYQSDYQSTHANLYDSSAKSNVDLWYENNLLDYTDYIDQDVGFCGDRIPYADEMGTSYGSGAGGNETYYASLIRLNNYAPSFECENPNDYYAISAGNRTLKYPIGLISADEVAYAGGVLFLTNQSYYLYTGQDYWLISPHSYVNSNANVFMITSSGEIGFSYMDSFTFHGIRPVINLKSDITIQSGSGTMQNPYIVS